MSTPLPSHDPRVQRQVAVEFAEKWTGRGYEKGDTASFWLELLRDVVGMEDVTTNVHCETRTSARGFIDVVIPDAKTVIEQKSLHVDLDKPDTRQGELVTPFEQAKRYADSLKNSQRPEGSVHLSRHAGCSPRSLCRRRAQGVPLCQRWPVHSA